MPLEKAQAFTRTDNYASMIYILLHDMDDTAAVKNAIQAPGYVVEDWEELNQLLLLVEQLSNGVMFFFNLMVLGVTSTVIMNTLLMAVYERTREMGILGALGMKTRQVKALFLTEAALLAVGGVLIGLAIGVPLSKTAPVIARVGSVIFILFPSQSGSRYFPESLSQL